MVWQPGVVMVAILGLFWFSEKQLGKMEKLAVLALLVFLAFFWQVAVGNFSRVGASYWVHRTVTADLTGYYTAGVNIGSVPKFVREFPSLVNNLPMHAKGHPPGGVLFYYSLNKLFGVVMTAVYSPFLLAFLSCLTIPLVYLISKNFRATFFSALIPSAVLFMPVLDVIYPLFGLTALLLGLRKKEFLAGVVFGIGLFFSYSILPVVAVIIFSIKQKITFLLGIIAFIALLTFVGYDFIETTVTVIGNQAARNFWVWLVFNPIDFVIFLGIPLAVLAWFGTKKKWLVVGLIVFTTIFSRGEVGRIWVPLMPLAAIAAGEFLTERKFESRLVLILLALQMVHVLVLQEFWVALW